jgi:DNA-binding NarL/FixJ family response regulator
VKKGFHPERSDQVIQQAIVLCGDVLLHRKLPGDLLAEGAGLSVVRSSEDREQIFSLCRLLHVSLFVARQAFLEQLLSSDLAQLTNYGKGSHVLAIMESDTVDKAAAVRLLRLGCRGVLPHRFQSKIFRRAVLTILRGEFWAPHSVVSELLSDLLTAAIVKNENGLTPQEARILELSSQGHKNSDIAEALGISPETVRWHKRRLNRKLRGATRLPQAKHTPPKREVAV